VTCRLVLRDLPVRQWTPGPLRGFLPSLLLHLTALAVLPPFDVPVVMPAVERRVTVFLVDRQTTWITPAMRHLGGEAATGGGRAVARPRWDTRARRLAAVGQLPTAAFDVAEPELAMIPVTPAPLPAAVAGDAIELPPAPPDEEIAEWAGMPPPVRMVHREDATFDVVIQSSASELLPEASGILGGAAVYTVYLPVGSDPQWILQYCGNTPDPQADPGGPIITLGHAAAPEPPYPRVSYAFTLSLPRVTGRYFLVHGWITASGQIENLRVVSEGNPSWNRALVTLLSRWQFRPALLQGKAIPVEILLAIPLEPS